MQLIMSAGWFAARAPCANPGSMHAMHEGSMHAIGRTSDWLQAWWRGGASPIRCIHTTEPRENSFAEFIISTASNLVQVGPTVHGCMDGRGCMVWGPALLASSSFLGRNQKSAKVLSDPYRTCRLPACAVSRLYQTRYSSSYCNSYLLNTGWEAAAWSVRSCMQQQWQHQITWICSHPKARTPCYSGFLTTDIM